MPNCNSICSKCKIFCHKEYEKLLDKDYEKKMNMFLANRYSSDLEKRFQCFRDLTLFLLSVLVKKMDDVNYREKNTKPCSECDKNFPKIKIRFIKSINASKIFNLLVDYDCFNIIKKAPQSGRKLFKFASVVRKKLLLFRGEDAPIDEDWKGYDYYYLRLFNYSYLLKNIIPDKLNYLRNQLREEIYCHSLASHGLKYEGWKEIEDLLS